MGYRSDVLVAMQFDDLDHMRTYLAKCKLLGDACLNEAIDDYSYCSGQGVFAESPPVAIMFVAYDGVKWYEGYPEVVAHHKLRQLAEEANACSLFIRLGEDQDDTEWDLQVYNENNGCVLAQMFDIERKLYTDTDVDKNKVATFSELEKHYES